MARTATVNLGAPGLSLGARLYVGGVPQDASSGVAIHDRGEGDYDFDVPLSPPFSLIVFAEAEPGRALWIFDERAPAALRQIPIPAAVSTSSSGLTRVAAGSDCDLHLLVIGYPSDPSGATVTFDLLRIGGGRVLADVAGQVRDVLGVSGAYAFTLVAPLSWSAWPTDPSPVTGYYFGRFTLSLGGAQALLPADTSLRLELTGAPA